MSKVVTLTFPPPPVDMAAEILVAPLDALTRAEIAATLTPSRETYLAVTQALNVLLDVSLQLGMPFDEPSITGWANLQACHALVAA